MPADLTKPTETARTIHVSAVAIVDKDGNLLTVRKHGTSTFMLPGGKPEDGETPAQTALREAKEEIGIELEPQQLRFMGIHRADAANEADAQVVCSLYSHPYVEGAEPAAEIEELAWVDPNAESAHTLAPLLTECVIPALRRKVNTVTVFMGASTGASPHFMELATEFGRELARRGITVVYGGGRAGLMGAVADGALEAGGSVIGVMPKLLSSAEIIHPGLTDHSIVSSMHERKWEMMSLGDAFVALPGGTGTLDELFDTWTSQQLGIHHKPIALYGSKFWGQLVEGLKTISELGFIRKPDMDTLVVSDDVDDLLDAFEHWERPSPRWA